MILTEAYAAFLPSIEAEMRTILSTSDDAVASHYAMMQYHMGWLDQDLRPAEAPTGKRIRPMLCVLSCGAAGGAPEKAVAAGAGLEILHNFSLVHDDIEDDSPTRRHRATVWRQFGVPLAINAGDGMFSLAHLAFFRLASAGVSQETTLAALRVFVDTCLALTEGQYMDMYFEDSDRVSVNDYFRMIRGKTGALLAASTEIGALIAGARADVISGYRRYGEALGRAFQLRDDLLGIWGDEAVTGKSTASDILSRKKTLPVLYALSREEIGPKLNSLYRADDFGPDSVPLALGLLDAAGAREFTEAAIHAAGAEASLALDELAPYSSRDYLSTLRELLAVLAERNA